MTVPGHTGSNATGLVDVDRTARAIQGDQPVRSPSLELRQGVVTAVDLSTATCSVRLGDSDVPIPLVKYLSNYKATVGDTCVVLVNGPDLWALDRDGVFGSAAFAGYTAGFVQAAQTRSSTSYGDLATVGPSITLNVPASGSILMGLGCGCAKNNTTPAGDAQMSFAASGANSWAAGATWPTVRIGELISANGVGPYAAMASVDMLTGLNPGSTTFTAKYIANGGTCTFDSRFMWAIPI